ncbi:hypothetical protein G3435_09350 [Pseudomonas sp. MAFF212428]|uniref:Secreted protein n=1 Tax=Pseudomonas brassicae TaxID=2708063 RepID=A0A6B3NNR7_9PSED|nr:hypothetical protein [Pseudomonas brassicae]NER60139.1 hypothetical protein [Pseudomonas brassicae]NER65052.1 hypothetical protein [Pseudomonas brassicae]
MSNSMGIASIFVLSSVLLSPLAMAEESPSFVAQYAAHAAAAQRGREALAQQHQDHAKGLEQTASKETAKADKDS